jgi:hypothetical protein
MEGGYCGQQALGRGPAGRWTLFPASVWLGLPQTHPAYAALFGLLPQVLAETSAALAPCGVGRLYWQVSPLGQPPPDIQITALDKTLPGLPQAWACARWQTAPNDGHRQQANIFLLPAAPWEDTVALTGVLLHELGHILGLEHSGSQDDVMHAYGRRPARFSPGDLAQCARIYRV